MSTPAGSVDEANAEGGDGKAGEDGAGEDSANADGNRTEVAEAKPLADGAEVALGTLTLRLVDSEKQAVADSHAQLVDAGFGGWPGANFVSISMPGEDNKEEAEKIQADENGNIVLTDIEPNKDLTLVLGGAYWARRTAKVTGLDPGEERDLGEIILSPGVLLSGRILGPDGKGVASASISLLDRNKQNDYGFNFGNAPGATQAEAETDDDGNFNIEGVRLGEYSLEANANGFVKASTSLDLVAGRPDHRVDLHLATGASVSGVVRDESGKPLPGSKVVLVRARGFSTYQWNHDRIMEKGTPVGEDGSFVLSGLSTEGKWRVAAAAPGFARGRSTNVNPGANVDIELSPRMELSGTVVDAAGEPVANAELSMMTKSADRNRDMFNRDQATSDEEGNFLFKELKQGTYRLEVSSAAGVTDVDPIEIGPENMPLKVVLPESHGLTVLVTDPDGNPLQDVRVAVNPEEGDQEYSQVLRLADASGVTMEHSGPEFGMRSRSAKTDENGLAVFYGLSKGNWTLTGRLENYAAQALDVECKEQPQEIELIMHPASKVRLTAVDATGQIVAGARVVLSMEGEDHDFYDREAVTDHWGLASWTGLAPGTYRISESASAGGELMIFDVLGGDEGNEEEPAAENDVVFELEGGVIMEQQIIMAAKAVTTVLVTRLGSPAADVTVELKSGNNDNFGWYGFNEGQTSARTDAQGLATLPPCDAGEYTLTARATSASPPTEMKVMLAPGQQQVALELASGVLTGTVVGTSGPVAGASVRLTPKTEDSNTSQFGSVAISFATGGDDDEAEIHTMDYAPGQTTARTDDKGQFRFQDVPAGEWQVKVTGKGYIPTTTDVGEFDGSGQRDLGIVQLETGGSLKGRVIGAPSNESPDGFSMNLLQLEGEDGRTGNMTVLRKSGEFNFKDLKPGVYTLTMHVGGEMKKSDPITVHAGDPTLYNWSL